MNKFTLTHQKETEEDLYNIQFEDSLPDLIPDGEYEMKELRLEKGFCKGADKLYVHMVVTSGGSEGTELYMAINKPKNKKASLNGKYRKSWVIANRGQEPVKGESLIPKVFKGAHFKVQVGSKGRNYSMVEELITRID